MKKAIALLLLLTLCVFAAQAEEEKAENITARCRIDASLRTDLRKMTDGNVKTYWKAGANNEYVEVSFPNGTRAGGLLIDWFEEPKHFSVKQYAQDGSVLNEYVSDDTFPAIVRYVPLDAETARARIYVQKNMRIAEVSVFSAGTLPGNVQNWGKPVEKADIMLISTHQDDEELWFGGTIPYYDVQQDCDMVVTYMASCGRPRRGEALAGLWAMGVRTYPEFLNLKDNKAPSYEESLSDWGGKANIIRVMVEVIRKYKPEVIVTHDLNGEYGHVQHKVTARLIGEAVIAAADPKKYSESAQKYGAWQVKKLYLHLNKTNTLYMDWETPSEKLGGLTPIEVAGIGFAQHKSQHNSWNMEKGKLYDNTKFGLVYSVVGKDVLKNDFLENTEADLRLKAQPAATPAPTPAPTPEPSPEPTPEPTPEPVFEPTQEPDSTVTPAPPEAPAKKHASGGLMYAGIAAIIIISGIGAYEILSEPKRKKHARKHGRKAGARRKIKKDGGKIK